MADQYEAPVPHLREDKEPRVNATQWAAIGLLIAVFSLLSLWLIFVRGRYLRSRECVECRQTVAKDGTECVAGYRCRIWHAGCHAKAEGKGRLSRSDSVKKRRPVVPKGLDRSGQPSEAEDNASGTDVMSDVGDMEKGEWPVPKFGAGDRPRLSVLVGRRPTRDAADSGESGRSLDVSSFLTATKTAPIHQARQGSHVRGSSVASHAASINILPILLRRDDPAYPSSTADGGVDGILPPSPVRAHSRPGSVSSRSSIVISLPASPLHDGKRGSTLPSLPFPLAFRSEGGQEVIKNNNESQDGKKRQSVLRCDTASIHSAHSAHSVHKPSPLRTSVAGIPAPVVPAVPELPVSPGIDGGGKGRSSRRVTAMFDALIRHERWAAPPVHTDETSESEPEGGSVDWLQSTPERSSSLPTQPVVTYTMSSNETQRRTPIEAPALLHPALAGDPHIHSVPSYAKASTTQPSWQQGRPHASPALEVTVYPALHASGGSEYPTIDFARPSSVDWRDSVNLAIQRASDGTVGAHVGTHEQAAGMNIVHAVATIPMPDPASYSKKPSR